MTDHEQIMVSALRYALGRQSYIVDVTYEYIMKRIPELSHHCKIVMIRDLSDRGRYGYQDPIIMRQWLKLLEELKESDKHESNNDRSPDR